mmetsp:Transcript_9390/g.13904  ORF Transcript_9390/g.13904 Transcript_9390/m.13904 type:complete len:113 (+) Transcript_9390:364-702(+)
MSQQVSQEDTNGGQLQTTTHDKESFLVVTAIVVISISGKPEKLKGKASVGLRRQGNYLSMSSARSAYRSCKVKKEDDATLASWCTTLNQQKQHRLNKDALQLRMPHVPTARF